MIQYIYFVKCPNCEDEHFDFFDDAKGFALGCLSKKPIITQTEVCRNDFGECTDSSDLGTVWSWEDEMKDAETEEPGTNIFNKGDFGEYNPDNDPEFADDDFFAVNNVEEAIDEKLSLTHGYPHIKSVATLVHNAVNNYTTDNVVATREDGTSFYVLSDKTNSDPEKMKQLIIDTLRKDGYDPEEVQYVERGNLYGYVVSKIRMTSRMTLSYKNESLAESAVFSLNNKQELDEFMKLCQEVGIKTIGDLDTFTKEAVDEPGTVLDKLRAYRDELGPDFKIKESVEEATKLKTWICFYEGRDIGTVRAATKEEAEEQMMIQYPGRRYNNTDWGVELLSPSTEACERKPVPEGMTVEQLVETMEENEDEVECTWCNDLFPKDMCKKEVNLGYLCPRCADGIMSRGETLTFKENNYWDFLDEKFDIDFEDEASSDMLDATSDAESDEFVEFDLDYPEID